MILLKETGGDTIQGAIDGVNVYYRVSFPFQADSVNVFVNGRMKVRAWEDGFTVLPPDQIAMKEALLEGDSLEIEYKAETQTGGGALGGVPDAPQLGVLKPTIQASQNLPEPVPTDMGATTSVTPIEPSLLSGGLKPTIINCAR